MYSMTCYEVFSWRLNYQQMLLDFLMTPSDGSMDKFVESSLLRLILRFSVLTEAGFWTLFFYSFSVLSTFYFCKDLFFLGLVASSKFPASISATILSFWCSALVKKNYFFSMSSKSFILVSYSIWAFLYSSLSFYRLLRMKIKVRVENKV